MPKHFFSITQFIYISKKYKYLALALVTSGIFLISISRTSDQYIFYLQTWFAIFFIVIIHTLATFNQKCYNIFIALNIFFGIAVLSFYLLFVSIKIDWFLLITRDTCENCSGMNIRDPRLFFGAYTPNEAGRHLLFLMFCITQRSQNVTKFLGQFALSALAVFTASKTVILQFIIYFIATPKLSKFLVTIFILILILYIFNDQVIEILQLFLLDFSAGNSSNSNRLEQYTEFFNRFSQFIYDPLFASKDDGYISSVHNGLFSMIANYSLLPSLIIISFILLKATKLIKKENRAVAIFIILDLFIYLFNPLLLGRHHFLPLAIYFAKVK